MVSRNKASSTEKPGTQGRIIPEPEAEPLDSFEHRIRELEKRAGIKSSRRDR